MAAPVSLAFRIAVNLAEMRQNLSEAKAQVETTKAAMRSMANSLDGSAMAARAGAMVKVVEDMGGAARLTEQEQKRVNATLTETLAKYKALGQEAPAAMLALHEATTQVEVPVSRLDTFLTDLQANAIGTAAGFVTAEAALGAVSGGFRMLSGFVEGSIQSYADAEAAQKTLTVALRAQGQATPDVIAQYNGLSAQMQKTTVVSDDMSTKMQGLLVQVGNVMPGEMQKALTASADLSAGLGIDLESATQLVAKAAAGHTETLGRYGVRVDEAKLKSEGFSAVLEAVNGQFGGQATAQLDTYSGRLQQIANNWDNAKEAVGGAILLDPKLQLLMRTLAQGTEAGATGAEKLSGSLNGLIEGSLRLIPVVGGPAAQTLHALTLAADEANKAAAEQANIMRLAVAGTKDFRFEKTAELDISTLLYRVKEAGREQDEKDAEAKRAAAEATKRATEENARFAENLKVVLQTSKGYEANVDSINGSVVEAIKYYRAHGVEMQALGEMYGLTSVQVRALTEAETAEQAMLTALTRGNESLAKAMSARNLLQRQSVEVMDEARGRTTVGPMTGGANPQLEAIRASLSVRAREFGQNFAGVLQQQLPVNIMAAITGGGSVWKAAGSTLGGFLVSDQGIGGTLKKGLTSVLGSSLGGAMSAMLPGIGALAGPLLEKLFSMGGPSKQEMAGRDAARNFEKGIAAGLTAEQRAEAGGRSWAMTVIGVRDAYLAVGRTAAEAEAAVQQMWAAERQGPEAVAAVQAGMQGVLDQAGKLRQAAAAFGPSQTELKQMALEAQQTYQYMLDAGVYSAAQLAAAFEDSQQKQARALGINTDAQKKNLDALQAGLTELTQKRDQLWGQIANEAPEDVMGVVEAGQRAQLATLDKQMEDQRTKLAAEAESAAAALEAALASVQGNVQPIIVPIVYDPEPFPGGGGALNPIPMANGGFGEVNGPTLFLAGEKGRREQVAFSGADQTFADRGFPGAGGQDLTRLQQTMDGIRSDLSRLPQMMGMAVRDQMVQRGRR